MIDEITLTIPRERVYQGVAHLVLGGLAVRLNLTIESLEDLQLALDAILGRSELDSSEVTVQMSVRDHELECRIRPLTRRLLDEIERETEDGIDLRRVLDSTVDDVHVDGDSVLLTKKVAIRD